MSGIGAQRGFIFQSLIAMIECLERSDWDAIKVEPKTENDKVDIQLYRNGQILTAIQVKSSQYGFSKPEVERWLGELRLDSVGANEICLYLVGDAYSAECVEYIRRNSKVIKKAPFENLESLCRGKLAQYVEGAGLANRVLVSELVLIDASLFSKIHRNSIATESLSREAFEKVFWNALPVHSTSNYLETGTDGITGIRIEIIDEECAKIVLKKHQIKNIDIIAFEMEHLRTRWGDDLIKCLKKGTIIRFLVMNPNSQFIDYKAIEDGIPPIEKKNAMKELAGWVNAANAETAAVSGNGKVYLKYYNSMTKNFYMRVDDCLYTGPYNEGEKSMDATTYKHCSSTKEYERYCDQFEEWWKNADDE